MTGDVVELRPSNPAISEVLRRLLRTAREDTSGSRVAANFLLAWWNGGDLGGFNLTELWLLDEQHSRDVLQVFAFVSANQVYPDALGSGPAFADLVRQWRPERFKDSPA